MGTGVMDGVAVGVMGVGEGVCAMVGICVGLGIVVAVGTLVMFC